MKRMIAAGSGIILLLLLAYPLRYRMWGAGEKGEEQLSRPRDLLLAAPDDLKRYALETFAHYTQFDRPKWESWHDKCDVHLLNDCKKLNTESNESELFHLLHGLQVPPQLNVDIRQALKRNALPLELQAVYYNDAAARSILSHHLFSKAILDDRLNGLLQNHVSMTDLDVPDFESGSVIVKTVWESIFSVKPTAPLFPSSPTGYSPIFLFNSTKILPQENGRLPQLLSWRPLSYVDTTQPDECKQTPFEDGYIYTLGCFLFREVSSGAYEVLRADERSAGKGPCSEKKCYLILMGVHIMTRETPNWVWMTYWWTNEGRSPSVSNKWDFFEAKASVNNVDSIANPYLEGPSSGVYSNCIRCHRFAAYNPSVQSKVGLANGKDIPPSPFEGDLLYPPCYFGVMLRTHFLWTVATHQDSSISQSTDPCADRTR